MWVGTSCNPLEAWMEQNSGRRLTSFFASLLELEHQPSLALSTWFSGLQTQTGIYTIGSLAIRPLN